MGGGVLFRMQPYSMLHSISIPRYMFRVLHRNSQISYGRLTIGPSIYRGERSTSCNTVRTVQYTDENFTLNRRLNGRNRGRDEEMHDALQLSNNSIEHTCSAHSRC